MISCIKQTGTCYVCGDIHDYRVRVNNSPFYVYIYDIIAKNHSVTFTGT